MNSYEEIISETIIEAMADGKIDEDILLKKIYAALGDDEKIIKQNQEYISRVIAITMKIFE